MEFISAIGKIPLPETEDDLRPISLTSFFRKVTKHFVAMWLLEYIGDQLDFKQFQEYLDKDFNEREVREGRPKISVKHDMVEDIKYTITKTIDSVKRKLDPAKRKGTFEILGYDFMVDYDMSVWLIECNTNPCFDESSKIL